MRRALELGASKLVLVNNRSSGGIKPTRFDIALARQIIQAAKPLRIHVADHFIISDTEMSSMRIAGLL